MSGEGYDSTGSRQGPVSSSLGPVTGEDQLNDDQKDKKVCMRSMEVSLSSGHLH